MLLVAVRFSAEAPLTLPSTSAVVGPPTIALGSETPIETMPPVPALESALARLFELALTVTTPLLFRLPPRPSFAVTSPDDPTRASAPAPAPPKARPMEVTSVVASASLPPLAVTETEPELVMLPSSSAMTPPLSSAVVPRMVPLPNSPPASALAVAMAVFFCATGPALAVSASTVMAPVVEIVAPPTSALMLALGVTSASANAPVKPASSETLSTSTSAVARFQPRACTSRLPPVRDASYSASVGPLTFAVGSWTVTERPPIVVLVMSAAAWFDDTAWTNTAPVTVWIPAPTLAVVPAVDVTSASADVPAPANNPKLTACGCDSALLADVEVTVNAEAPVTSPTVEAEVPPSTSACGRLMLSENNSPPVPPSSEASAWLLDDATT